MGLSWRWRGAFALALIVGILPFLFLRHSSPAENLAKDRQLLLETEKLFPNQINSVVERNGKVDLSIAQEPVLGAEQPVVVIFKRGRETIRVLSFSGQRVCLKLGKTESCFDILATPAGGVILEGKDRVWLASEHVKMGGYSVGAQMLEARL